MEVTAVQEGTGRCEAFSDGIFAIAATLLVLELRLPHAGVEGSLWDGLVALWPSYLAFALSFFVILVTWVSHHDLMRLVRGTSRLFLMANGFALFYVAYVPFPTAVLAANLAGPNIRTAVAFYCGTFVLGSVAVNLLIAAIVHDQLFRPEVDERAVARARRALRLGFLVNVAATAVALVLPWVALALSVALRLYWLRLRYQPARSTLRHAAPLSQ
jgi:uncharacterized membrane protein